MHPTTFKQKNSALMTAHTASKKKERKFCRHAIPAAVLSVRRAVRDSISISWLSRSFFSSALCIGQKNSARCQRGHIYPTKKTLLAAYSCESYRVEMNQCIVVHSLITGPWKLKSCSKSSFGVKSVGIKKQKLGSVIFTRFVSLICAGIFWHERDVILAPLFSRHLAGTA